MTRRYLETSALLRVLLERDEALRPAITGGDLFTSTLTFVEASRAVARALREGRLDPRSARDLERQLASIERACELVGLDEDVLRIAREPLPEEPVRTLDALHLASVRVLDAALGGFEVVSCDARVRRNAVALGFTVLPSA